MIITRKGFKTALVTDVLDWVRISGTASVEAKHAPQREIPTRLKVDNVTQAPPPHSSWGLDALALRRRSAGESGDLWGWPPRRFPPP